MKKFSVFLLTIFFILGVSAFAGATTYTFEPSNTDLWDLDHHYYYTWGSTDQEMNDALGSYSVIEDISITFKDIYNWSSSDPSNLFVWMLNDFTLGVDGVGKYSDSGGNSATIEDEFTKPGYTGIHLVTYETPDTTGFPDIPAGWANKTTITYHFTQDEIDTFAAYLADDNTIGLGFDPDCHYYNSGISLSVTVPEPSTMFLLGIGLIGLAGLGRKRYIKG